MKEKKYFLNTALITVVTVAVGAAALAKTFFPAVILPRLNIPNLMLLSLIALLLDHYLARGAQRCYLCVSIFSLLTFGLLPLAAGFATVLQALRLAVVGCAVFTAATWLFSSVQDRLSSGPAAKAAAVLSALGLYLASQCFAGMIL